MADETTNPVTHHEKSDVPVRTLLWFVVIFLVFAAITHVILYGMYKLYVHQFNQEPPPPRTAMRVPAAVPETPRLQPFPEKGTLPIATTPVIDMVKMHADEQQALDNPGWLDKGKGRVRIPIARAKELVVQRGMAVNGGGQ